MLQDAERTRQRLSSYTKLTGERLDAMHSIIAQQQTEMDTVLGNLRDIAGTINVELNAITVMAEELAQFVKLHDAVQALREGLTDLTHGMITAKLISPRDMYEAIQDMTQSMRERWITGAFCFKTPGEIYRLKNFEVARHGQDVIVRIYVPYTSVSK